MTENPEIAKLDRLLKEQKITTDEYWELYNNLPKSENSNENNNLSSSFSSKPWQVKFCSIFLFVVAVYDIVAPPHHFGSVVAALLSLGLGYGLLKRSKIAFLVTIVIGLVSIFYSFDKNSLFAIILNSIYCIILGSVWRHYFPKNEI